MAEDQSHVEIEQKYDAAADVTLPDLSDLPGVAEVTEPRTSLLVATYFDTADQRLAARGITLRRRRGGSDAGWHLKIPVGPDAKREVHAPLGRAQVVPAKLADLVAAYTRGEPLRLVATLETSRTVVRLLDAEGTALAEIADDSVAGQVAEPAPEPVFDREAAAPDVDAGAATGTGDREGEAEETGAGGRGLEEALERAAEQAIERSVELTVELAEEAPSETGGVVAWREIEVELLAGSPALLKAAGKRLRKAGARRAASGSKLGRLLGTDPAAGSVHEPAATGGETAARDDERPAGSGTGSGIGTATAAADTVLAYVTAQRDAILTNDPRARLAEHDAVHKMRVAVRRLRSTLKSYRSVLDRERTDPLQPELKWLTDTLGEVRDLEVLRMRFAGRLEHLPRDAPGAATARSNWLEALERQEKTAYRRLNQTLKGARYFALLDALDELIADPPLTEWAAAERQDVRQVRSAPDATRDEVPNGSGTPAGERTGENADGASEKSGTKGEKGRPGKRVKPGKGERQRRKRRRQREEKAAARARRARRRAEKRTRAELARFVRAAWRRVEKAYAAIDHADDVEAARHATRRAAKRARYAAEAAVPVLGAPAALVAAEGEHLQEVLGGYQDGMIAMDHLRSIAGRISDPDEAFIVGLLYGIEHAEAEAARAKVDESLRRSSGLRDL